MQTERFPIPLIVPRALADDEERIIEDFAAEGLEASINGVYATKASGPLPDANFWINLVDHAKEYPFDRMVEGLEVALGVKILNAFSRIAKWAGKRILIHLRLPTKRQDTQYIISDEPDALSAVKAIAKHYRTIRENPANEYWWKDGTWMSAQEYFAKKRERG